MFDTLGQTVGMYAGAKREREVINRSENGLDTIGLERTPRGALAVRTSRLVGRMGLNCESKTATQGSEDKNNRQ